MNAAPGAEPKAEEKGAGQGGGRKPPEAHTRINANIPDELHRALKVRCAAEGRTVTEVLTDLIRRYVGQ